MYKLGKYLEAFHVNVQLLVSRIYFLHLFNGVNIVYILYNGVIIGAQLSFWEVKGTAEKLWFAECGTSSLVTFNTEIVG